jgi:hypothetical protein
MEKDGMLRGKEKQASSGYSDWQLEFVTLSVAELGTTITTGSLRYYAKDAGLKTGCDLQELWEDEKLLRATLIQYHLQLQPKDGGGSKRVRRRGKSTLSVEQCGRKVLLGLQETEAERKRIAKVNLDQEYTDRLYLENSARKAESSGSSSTPAKAPVDSGGGGKSLKRAPASSSSSLQSELGGSAKAAKHLTTWIDELTEKLNALQVLLNHSVVRATRSLDYKSGGPVDFAADASSEAVLWPQESMKLQSVALYAEYYALVAKHTSVENAFHVRRELRAQVHQRTGMSDTVLKREIARLEKAVSSGGVWDTSSHRGEYDRNPFFERPAIVHLVKLLLMEKWKNSKLPNADLITVKWLKQEMLKLLKARPDGTTDAEYESMMAPFRRSNGDVDIGNTLVNNMLHRCDFEYESANKVSPTHA